MYRDLEDGQLMLMIASANHEAFAELVGRHTDRFFALAFRSLQNRSDAEDVLQSAFIKLWQKPKSWDANQSKFTTWFYRVIINACHDQRRKFKPEIELSEQLLEAVSDSMDSEQRSLERWEDVRWRQHCVEVAVSQLPSSQRDTLNLVVYFELPQKQVADILGISVKAVESLLIRAKRSMTKTVNELNKQRVGQEIRQGTVNRSVR